MALIITKPDKTVTNVENDKYISGVGQLTTFIELGKRLGITDFKADS